MEWQITEMGLSLPIVAVCYVLVMLVMLMQVKIK